MAFCIADAAASEHAPTTDLGCGQSYTIAVEQRCLELCTSLFSCLTVLTNYPLQQASMLRCACKYGSSLHCTSINYAGLAASRVFDVQGASKPIDAYTHLLAHELEEVGHHCHHPQASWQWMSACTLALRAPSGRMPCKCYKGLFRPLTCGDPVHYADHKRTVSAG